ncbi:uncharacterized protein L203_100614 [Cryptococcus depauperatus CBS 7841]|uniref:Uncharacterized protein n=1 Tax=Cryptococcus depauperatus CBS 7841 TaxID=1295531 RepID=A0A1E3IZK1_9TREE|nr:hypothetical protein L203_00400 [Cryptococcus depauperatus CBS 7841]
MSREGYPSSDNTIVASSPSHPSHRSLSPNLENGKQSLKRRKISPELYQDTEQSFKPEKPEEVLEQHESSPTITALLYHHAQQAHQAAQHHYQQAFLPGSVSLDRKAGYPLIKLCDLSNPFYHAYASHRFFHDPEASAKALGLQLFALDLLKTGLGSNKLSNKERVAFSLEFGLVGIKVYSAWQAVRRKGRNKETEISLKIDYQRLIDDLQDVVGQACFIAQRQSSLLPMKLELELLNIRLAFMQGKFNFGKRLIQSALTACKNDISHRYNLYLVYLEHIEHAGPVEYLSVVDELIKEARLNKHTLVLQLALLIKTRITFVHRRWEVVSIALADFASAIGWSDETSPTELLRIENGQQIWLTSLCVHYLLLRALWEGRIGNDAVAKGIMKKLYVLMDETADKKVFNSVRATGGVMSIPVPNYRPLQIQTTPPNILYMLTYLTTVVARRDFTGSDATCKSVVHPKVLRETEGLARAEDMWDIGFSAVHGLAHVIALRKEVMAIRGELMIEQATALIYRSSFREGRDLLYEIADFLKANDLFYPLSPHLCLIFAQHAHHLGATLAAVRYYEACKVLINSGSELSLIASIGSLASENKLEDLDKNVETQDYVNVLAEMCKGSNSAMFSASGYFLASLTDENRVNSKKELSTAYELSQKSNNNILRLLIFAFTTSTHHYGGRERMLRQLETGIEISRMVGGKDRPDGVGQIVLGLWFARRLKEFWRQEGQHQGVNAAKESIQRHLARLDEVRLMGVELSQRQS